MTRKVKAFLKLWVTPITPLEPGVRYPIKNSYSIAGTSLALFLVFWYFYGQVPYESIPNKLLFWPSFIGWASILTLFPWAFRNTSSRRELRAFGNLMIIIGIVGLVMATWGWQFDTLRPAGYAMIPGVLTGALIGGDLVWFWTMYKHREERSKKGTAHNNASESRKLETTTEDTHIDQY